MASDDDDILRLFEQQLDQIKTAPTKEKTREDLIEQATENFGTFFDFVAKLDVSVKEKMGTSAGVRFDFGDYDENNSKLNAFLIISPPEAERENLTIIVRFQGKRVQFDNPAFRQANGSSTYDPGEINEAKVKLAGVVAGWMKNT